MKRVVSLALAVLVHSDLARAENQEEIIVRGTQAGGFASKARLEDSPREVTDAASLVEALPGVHVRRSGADDAFSTLSVRGTSSTEVAVFLAGVPLTGGADPTLDLATLPLWPGARARVYRSFAPASLGPGSLGGTLVLDPPSETAGDRAEVWGAIGSFGAMRMRVADTRKTGEDGSRVTAALSASRSDDDFSYYDTFANAFRARENAGHAAVNGLVGWSVPIRVGNGDPGRLTVTTLAQARRQHLSGPITGPTPHQMLDSDREIAAIETMFPAAKGAWTGRVWARRDGLRLSDPLAVTSPTHTDDAIAALGFASGWRGRPVDDVTFEAHVDGSGERFAPGAWIGAETPPGATRAAIGLASDVEWRATRALTTTASGRLDTWHDGGDAGVSGGGTKDEIRPTGHLGAELRAGAFGFAAHGGALARAPSFIERYGNRGAFVGDPSLRPESAWTVDAGTNAVARAGKITTRADLVGFATWADDLIAFKPTGLGTSKAFNVGRARILGLEAALEARGFGFDVRASYTGLATTNESECVSQSCPPLIGRPAHDLVGDVAYALGPVRLRYGIDVVSGINADLTGQIRVPARVLQSTGLRIDVPHVTGLRLALDVRNLFDVRTVTYAGAFEDVRAPIGDQYNYPLPGRSFLFTARWAHSP